MARSYMTAISWASPELTIFLLLGGKETVGWDVLGENNQSDDGNEQGQTALEEEQDPP